MSRFRTVYIIGFLLGSASVHSTPALAQSSPADVQARVDALDAKVRELERQLAAARTGHDGAQPAIVLPPVTANDAVPDSPPTADSPAPATPAPRTLDALETQIEQLDQQIGIVSRQLEIEREQAGERAKTTPVVGAGREGFAMRSADGAFQLRLRGYIQSDGRFYADDHEAQGADTFLLRRVRPILEGTLFKNVDFRLMPDFGGGTTVLQDAYIDLRFTPAVKIRAGKFKTPVGLERLASATELLFVERALPTALAPNRDAGVLLFGDVLNARLNYSVGVVNGVVDGASADADDRDGKDAVARDLRAALQSQPPRAPARARRRHRRYVRHAAWNPARAKPAGIQDQRSDRVRAVSVGRHRGGGHHVRRRRALAGITPGVLLHGPVRRAGGIRVLVAARPPRHRDGASGHRRLAGRDVRMFSPAKTVRTAV